MVGEYYVTKNGVRLRVGRISRHVIDGFLADNPEPEPPTVMVTVFGDVEEEAPDYSDPAYLLARQAWAVKFGEEMFDLLAEAVEVPDDALATGRLELEELWTLGMSGTGDKAALLRYSILTDEQEMGTLVELVLYNSTVTVRGMEEAADAFNVTWMGQRIPVIDPARGKATANQLFGERQAATAAGYKWHEFCELPGPEQSAIVAHHRLATRLEALALSK